MKINQKIVLKNYDELISAILKIVNADKAGKLRSSIEYNQMIEVLGCEDVYRSKNRFKAGYTILSPKNRLFKGSPYFCS